MLVIKEIKENIKDVDTTGLVIDPVIVDHEDTRTTHHKFISNRGREIALSLPLGSELKDGDILYRDAQRVIYVDLQPEDVIHIRPEQKSDWAKAAYNIGNMHQQAYLKDDGIYVPYDEFVLRIVRKLDLEFDIEVSKLNGQRAAVQGGEHYHRPEHGHSHDHE